MGNKLTWTEIHAMVLGGAIGLLVGVTEAWGEIRAEPWYCVGAALPALYVGIKIRRRYYAALERARGE